ILSMKMKHLCLAWLTTFIFFIQMQANAQYIKQNSEIQKCMNEQRIRDQQSSLDPSINDDEEGKEGICRTSFNLTIDCIIKNSLGSNHTLDLLLRNSTSMARWKTADKYLCSRYRNIAKKTKLCVQSSHVCMKSYNWHIYTWCVPDTRCYYTKIHHCSESLAVIWGKYALLAKSNTCILSDQHFQLYPLYGVELKCYKYIHINVYETLDWIYRRFCRKYNYWKTLNCIRIEIGKYNSVDLDEEKDIYLRKAETFAKNRYILCERLKDIPEKACNNNQQENITHICLKDLYYTTNKKEKSLPHSVRIYSDCLYKQYERCNKNLARIIRDNILTYITPHNPRNGSCHLYPELTWTFVFLIILHGYKEIAF
ncbi:hypothetical protein Ahia01_000311300, partial [Argonauta hians]